MCTTVFSHTDTFDRAHPGAHASPLMKPPVFTGTHQVLAPPVVGVLVEDPVAVLDLAGVDVVEVEAFEQRGAVVGQLHRLASELRALEDRHSVSALVLQRRRGLPSFLFVCLVGCETRRKKKVQEV